MPFPICNHPSAESQHSMATYASLQEFIGECRAWLAADGPWTVKEWHRRITFGTVANAPDLSVRDKAVAWAIGVDWIRLPPRACSMCGGSLGVQRDTRYPLSVCVRGSSDCCAAPSPLTQLCRVRPSDYAGFPLFLLMYMQEDSSATIQREVGISRHTLAQWRDRVQLMMYRRVVSVEPEVFQIGGDNVIVEIDETLLNRLKPVSAAFQRLRRRRQQIWAWGAIERLGMETGRFLILILEADLDKPRGVDSLKACIEKCVAKGSRIVHDDWGAYRSMPWGEMGYLHDERSVVNHAKEAVNVWGEHTNHIESLWSASKRWARSRCQGKLPSRPEVVERLLWEYIWRHRCSAVGASFVSEAFTMDWA